MPPKPLLDLSSIDLSRTIAGPDEIRQCNRQRYEMEHLDGVVHVDLEEGVVVGFKDVGDDEFWVRGHVPGRPLLPGVIMCEAAAQLCSFYFAKATRADKFLGFAGLQDVKFRRPVVPGQRLILVGLCRGMKGRGASFDFQGFVDGTLVPEGQILGMVM